MANSYVHYQIWRRNPKSRDDSQLLRTFVTSGTLVLADSGTPSPVISVDDPTVEGLETVAIFKVKGAPAYITFNDGKVDPSRTNAHAGADKQPSMLVDEADVAVQVVVPNRCKIGAVQAAAFS